MKALHKQRAVDCIINTIFEGSNEPEKNRDEYCEKNCNYRCKRGEDYKRICNDA